jgi:hypothetical protein
VVARLKRKIENRLKNREQRQVEYLARAKEAEEQAAKAEITQLARHGSR